MEWNLMAVAAVGCLIQQIPVHLKRHMDEKKIRHMRPSLTDLRELLKGQNRN